MKSQRSSECLEKLTLKTNKKRILNKIDLRKTDRSNSFVGVDFCHDCCLYVKCDVYVLFVVVYVR